MPFLLVLLYQGDRTLLPQNLRSTWQEAVKTTTEVFGKESKGTYQGTLEREIQSVTLGAEEASKYLGWCVVEVNRRVDAIVGEQHRGSYDKTAMLLAALGEVLTSRDLGKRASTILDKYRQKYSPHRTFQQYLRKASGV